MEDTYVLTPANTIASSDQNLEFRPHVLLVATGQLASTARMAIELHDAGADIGLIAPRNHPAWALKFLGGRRIYRARAPMASLRDALAALRPTMVIPCDERAVRDLHGVWRSTNDRYTRQIIENSAGSPGYFSTIVSRASLLALARGHGIRVPEFGSIAGIPELRDWCASHSSPFVLKADGSWAGFGVRIVSSADRAEDMFRQMTRRASARLALRESLLEGNHFGIRPWLQGHRPTMSIQAYINGWPANIGVACWRGEVLASICAEAVSTSSATGPSTVVRIIDNPEMVEAAYQIVRALGLSGMIGFDFMLEASTGAAYLIEMNPRNTPICALRPGPSHDLAEALIARIAGRPARTRPPRTLRDVVAFFPDTWRADPANQFLRSGFHDVPWEYPELVRRLMQRERRERYWTTRLLRKIWLAVPIGNSRGR